MVGWRHLKPTPNACYFFHRRNNARACMPSTARWYAVVCALEPPLIPGQCLTEDGKELTRVCMIDYGSGIVVYDKLVKPPKPVIDYLTKYARSSHISTLPHPDPDGRV